jgi:hypothetical protein
MPTKFVIVCSGPLWARPTEWIKQTLLVWYDPDFNKGEGRCEFTYDITKAQLFDTLERAVAYVERVPINNYARAEGGYILKPIKCFEVSYRAIDVESEKQAIDSPRHFLTPTAARYHAPPPPDPFGDAMKEVMAEDRKRRC